MSQVPRSARREIPVLSPSSAASVTRLSAVDTVRARILLAIEHGLLLPGEKLPDTRALANGLDVSEITARRALESLVADAVVVRRRGRGGGSFVTDAPPATNDSSVNAYRADGRAIHQLIDQRSLMESAIVFSASECATSAECDELEALCDLGERATSWVDFHGADRRFHHRVAEISQRPEAGTYVETYEVLIKYFLPYPIEHLHGSNREHRELVAALRARDASAAVAVTRRHVDDLHRDMFMELAREEERGG